MTTKTPTRPRKTLGTGYSNGAGFEFTHGPVPGVESYDLERADLAKLSSEMPWSLSVQELEAIRRHFHRVGRRPTDVEMEMLAQTWSEHCKHKTLSSPIEYVEDGKSRPVRSLISETIFEATRRLDKKHCLSVFKDNAGIVVFDKTWALAFKVETHNHPCALEPYGGAETGVGGVIRDVLGAGLGAKPILNTDVFCVGLPDDKGGPGRHAPRRTLREMVSGVRDYGNRMGIPTLSGAVYFDAGYRANPLCFAGTLGLIPRDRIAKTVRPGDLVVAIGGRTGKDGLHGATGSSGALEGFASSSVQIGHAILEKRMLDALMRARDLGLYRSVTDCGAGGFSSAVGEMAEGVGARIELDHAPLKYEGLLPWEIWLSESQERMVLAVPPDKFERLEAVLEAEGVESAVLGRFSGDNRLVVASSGRIVADLDLNFLHHGLPKRARAATYRSPKSFKRVRRGPSPDEALTKLLAHPNIASREWVVRQYDHEVQAQSAVKPLQGRSGPGDACVVWPTATRTGRSRWRGVAAACGMAPELGKLDPRLMAFAAVDEALRNLAAVGADVAEASILDNFCWGETDDPVVLGRLVRCAFGCRDAALAYGAPFISGKDSLHNSAKIDGKRLDIPGTLLVSAIAPMPDVRRAVTMDFKGPDHAVYLVGRTTPELGGSHYARLVGGGGRPPRLPNGGAALLRDLAATVRAGRVVACHDLSEGGLGVALSEMAIAGGLGVEIRLGGALRAVEALFAESLTRWLVEVEPASEKAFLRSLSGWPVQKLGHTGGDRVTITSAGRTVVDESVVDLDRVFRRALPTMLGEKPTPPAPFFKVAE